MNTETGLRLESVERGQIPRDFADDRVCYWSDGFDWWIYLPRGGVGRLTNHAVTEHEDGTITVSPSIGMNRAGAPGGFARHGFLTCGEWREV